MHETSCNGVAICDEIEISFYCGDKGVLRARRWRLVQQPAKLENRLHLTGRTPATTNERSPMPIAQGIHFFHRQIWQRLLPQRWRRSALFHSAAFVAPRVAAKAKPSTPVIVAGALSTASGLGMSGRLCHEALKLCGFPVHGIDLSRWLMQPMDANDLAITDDCTHIGPGTLIIHINSPLLPLAMWRLGRRLVRDKYVIGYWAWELPEVPADWRHGIPFVHEIWVPSAFTANAMRSIAAGRPVRIVPHPVALRGTQPASRTRVAGRPFTVLSMFDMASSFARKNPLASIEAFRQAFGDDPSARLIIKTHNALVYRSGLEMLERALHGRTNVVLLNQTMSKSELDDLYNASDVVISLHRSDGFGLLMAEAMLRGLPVVATNWSGNTDFLNSETGIPVFYRLVPAEDPQAIYHHPHTTWADPDVEAASLALRRLRDDEDLARRLGQQAARLAVREWSAAAYARKVQQHLQLNDAIYDSNTVVAQPLKRDPENSDARYPERLPSRGPGA